MSLPFKVLSCLLVIVLLHACTIEKRAFRKGYHIEWKRKITAASSDETIAVTKEHREERPVEINTAAEKETVIRASEPVAEEISSVEKSEELAADAPLRSEEHYYSQTNGEAVEKTAVAPGDDEEAEEDYKRDNLNGFIIGIAVILGLLFIGLIALTLSFGSGALFVEGILFLVLLAVLLIILFSALLITLVNENARRQAAERRRVITEQPVPEKKPEVVEEIPEDESSPDRMVREAEQKSKKRRALIAVSVLLAVVAGIIVLGSL